MTPIPPIPSVHHFEVRFQSLRADARALAFPCDAAGRVDMDRLTERARNDYLFARATVGRQFARPSVVGA
jgi:hypothetical protein